MRRFYEQDFENYEASRTATGFVLHSLGALFVLWFFYVGPALSVLLLPLPWILRKPGVRLSLLAGLGVLLALLAETWMQPHYFAPATALVYLLILRGMSHLRRLQWQGRLVGIALVRAIPIVCLAMVILRLIAISAHANFEPPWPPGNWSRMRVLQNLESLPGRQLVMVRYAADHDGHNEWVYNLADIDKAKVLWAREMGPDNDRELLEYFKDRTVWLLCPDNFPIRLEPLPVPESGNTVNK
jgi:hypothetical protein